MMNRCVCCAALLLLAAVAVKAAPPPKQKGSAASGKGAASPTGAKSKVLMHVYNLGKQPMPKGAVKSKLSAEEVQKRIASGKIKPLPPPANPQIARQAMKQSPRDLKQEVAKLFRDHPVAVAKITQAPHSAGVQRLRDGNLKHTIVDNRGKQRSVVTMGPERRLWSLAVSKQSLADPKRRAQLYEVLHGFANQYAIHGYGLPKSNGFGREFVLLVQLDA